MLDTRGHLLLDWPRWAFHRERLKEWLQSVCASDTVVGVVPPTWGWDFLVGTPRGPSIAWPILGSSATSLDNEGSALVRG